MTLEDSEPAPQSDPHRVHPRRSFPVRLLWMTLGLFFVGIGILGIVLPGLPTTPFLLLAAACFARSSQRLYDRLLASPLGPAIRDLREGKGVSRRVKVWAIGTMWVFVLFALTLGMPATWVVPRIVVGVAAVVGTIAVSRLNEPEQS